MGVTLETVTDYWFVSAGGFVVVAVSYGITTLASRLFLHRDSLSPSDFNAVRIAATFPSVIALPILIFPSLCEYPTVYRGYILYETALDHEYDSYDATLQEPLLIRQCVAQANTMIFCFFLTWSLAYWIYGNPTLLKAASITQNSNDADDHKSNNNRSVKRQPHDPLEPVEDLEDHRNNDPSAGIRLPQPGQLRPPLKKQTSSTATASVWTSSDSGSIESDSSPPEGTSFPNRKMNNNKTFGNGEMETDIVQSYYYPDDEPFWHVWWRRAVQWISAAGTQLGSSLYQTLKSPGFLAMALGFLTACFPKLQQALFDTGGAFRFLGSSLETLGTAAMPLNTMVVAASLVPPARPIETTSASSSNSSVEQPTAPDCGEEEDDFNNLRVNEQQGDLRRSLSMENQQSSHYNASSSQRQQQLDADEEDDAAAALIDPNYGPYHTTDSTESSSSHKKNNNNKNEATQGIGSWLLSGLPQELQRRLGVPRSPWSSLPQQEEEASRASRGTRTALDTIQEDHNEHEEEDMWRIHLWFIASKLILAPAAVTAIILILDCNGGTDYHSIQADDTYHFDPSSASYTRTTGFLSPLGVYNLAKLVLIVCSAMPGALIVIVVLKSNPTMIAPGTVAKVAQVFLPSYLVSIVTIAAWTAIGMYVTLPDQNGHTFCQR